MRAFGVVVLAKWFKITENSQYVMLSSLGVDPPKL
jgi:hypothetical protein